MHCLHWYGTALFTLLSYCIVYLSIVLRPTSTTQHLKNIKSGQFDPFPLVRVIDLKKHNIQIYLEYSVLETNVSDTHNSDRMILVSTVGAIILRMPNLFRVFNRGYRIKIKLICRLTKALILISTIERVPRSELGTLEWLISGILLYPLFFFISRLKNTCSRLVINVQIK